MLSNMRTMYITQFGLVIGPAVMGNVLLRRCWFFIPFVVLMVFLGNGQICLVCNRKYVGQKN